MEALRELWQNVRFKQGEWFQNIYKVGFAITFLWIWIPGTYNNWVNAWTESSGIADFIISELIFNFGIEEAILSFYAGFWSALWPLYWFTT